MRKKIKQLIKKVGKNFSGSCNLEQLPKGTVFRTEKGKEVYIKDRYDKLGKKYLCVKSSDYLGSEKWMSGNVKVRTDFEW